VTGIKAEAARAVDWFEDHISHHGAPAPSFTPSGSPQPEVPVSSAFTELQHLLSVADEDALHAVNVVLSHPEGIAAISMVASLAGFAVPAGTITSALGGVGAILGIIAPATAPAAPVSTPQQAQAAQAAQVQEIQ
jgi:hypothetical protein